MSLDTLKKNTGTNAPAKRSYTWLLPLFLVIGFLLVFALIFAKKFLPAVEVNTAPVVTLQQALEASTPDSSQPSAGSRGKMLFQATGWVEPDPYTTYVPTLTNGIVKEVHVLEGESVKKDQLLATLIKEDAQLDLRQAERKVEATRAKINAHCATKDIHEKEILASSQKAKALSEELKSLEDQYQRLNRITSGAISEQDRIKAKFLVTRQQALIEEAKAEIPQLEAKINQIDLERESLEQNLEEIIVARDRAKLAFDRTEIRSPMNGIVLKLHAAPGKKRFINMDDPNSAVIVELYDPEKLQARIDVPLTEAAALSVGQSVDLTSDLLPDTEFKGTVTRITGEADIQRNTLQVKVSIQNPDPRLRPGMLVRGKFYSISSSTAPGTGNNTNGRIALYAPENALFDIEGSKAKAWVVSADNTAEMRSLTISAIEKDDHRMITEGLRSGEQIILPPFEHLTEGTRVSPVTAKISDK